MTVGHPPMFSTSAIVLLLTLRVSKSCRLSRFSNLDNRFCCKYLKRKCERKCERESERKSERKSDRKCERKSERKNERKSDRKCERKSERKNERIEVQKKV